MSGFSKRPSIFLFFFRQNLINSETILSQLISFVYKYLSSFLQASVLLNFQYAAKLSREERRDLFLQRGPFPNFLKFFQEMTWSQSFCEML